jgi:hypothetical protein
VTQKRKKINNPRNIGYYVPTAAPNGKAHTLHGPIGARIMGPSERVRKPTSFFLRPRSNIEIKLN